MIIQVNNKWRIEKCDSLNYTIAEYRSVTNRDGETRMDWKRHNVFAGSLAGICKMLLDKMVDGMEGEADLMDVIAAIGGAKNEIVKAVKSANGKEEIRKHIQ